MSAVPQRHKFVLYAPDMTDPEAFERRMQVRSKHLERAAVLTSGGSLRLGGAMLSPESLQPGAERKMVGSVMIFEADSLEDANALVLSDVYYTAKVWDAEKLVIRPIVLATQSLEKQ